MYAEWPPVGAPPANGLQRRIWRGSDLALGVGLLMLATLATIAASIAVSIISGGGDDAGVDTPGAFVSFVFESLIGLIVVWLAARRHFTPPQLGFVALHRFGLIPGALGLTYLSLVGYHLVLQWLAHLGVDVSAFDQGNALPVGHETHPLAWVLLGISVIGVAPIAEELFFRAFIFRAALRFVPVPAAYAISGFGFALFHLNPSVVVPFTIVGAIFAWAYWTSGSLWTSIAVHATVNTLSFVVTIAQASR
jgi:membrane protease YdiL (CAAX protease family)